MDNLNFTMGGDTAALFGALAKAQASMGAAKKGAKNPHFKSTFADLASVLEAILPDLNANGLALVQLPGFGDGMVTMTTVISHSGGGWIASQASSPLGRGSGPQAVGSTISYLRRYCAQAALSLPVIDDDGEAAMGGYRANQSPARRAAAKDPSWADDYKEFMANASKLVDANGGDLMEAIVAEASGHGFKKRPSEMTSKERGDLLCELRGGVF